MSHVAAVAGRRRVTRDIAGQLVLRAANLGLGVVVTLLVVRALGAEGFGQWSTALAISTVAAFFGAMGLERAAVERSAAEPDRQPEWVGAALGLRVVLAIPATIVSLVVGLLLADGREMRIAVVLFGLVLLAGAVTAPRIVFQLEVRNTTGSAVEVAKSVVWTAFVALALVVGATGVVEIATGYSVVMIGASFALLALVLRRAPVRVRAGRRLWGPLLRVGVPIGVGSLLVLGYGYLDQVLLFELAGAREAGLYGAAYRIYERLTFVPSVLMTTLFPVIVAAVRADSARVRRLVRLAVNYLLMFSLPTLTITLAGPESLVRLLFGKEFAAAGPALPVLMAGFTVVSVGYLTGFLIIAYQLQKRFVLIALLALVFNLAANLALIPRYGFMAAAWITLATELLVCALSLAAVIGRLGFLPVDRTLARIVLAAVAVGVVGWMSRTLGAPVLVWAGLATLAYPPLLVALGALDLDDLRALRRGEPA